MIAIRVDGNNKIGLGHVNRCVSIAQGLRCQGERVIFILSDDYSEEYIVSMGFETIVLDIDYSEIEDDIDIITKYVSEYAISVILVDSYYASDRYLEKLSRHIKVACIDGLYKYTTPGVMIINYNAAAQNGHYDDTIFRDNKKLIGLDYVPLKESFWNYDSDTKKTQIKKVLITVGATDKLFVCEALLESIFQTELFDAIEFDVVVGKFFPNIERFINHWGAYENINLIVDCMDLSPYMKNADVAISSAGTTVYELLRYNIPSILIAIADNQLSAEALSEYYLWIGDVRNGGALDKDKVNEVITTLFDLIENNEKYMKIVNRCSNIVDGEGALRIAKEIIQFGKA